MRDPAELEREAEAAAAAGRHDEALARLREAREARRGEARQPGLLRSYAALGRCHLAAGQLDEAESAARTAIQQARVFGDPRELGLGLLLLGRVLARTPRSDRALLAFTEAVSCLRGRDEGAEAEAAEALRAVTRVPGGAR